MRFSTTYNALLLEPVNQRVENVLGKIVTRWADWKIFADEDLYYHNGRLYEHSGSASTVSTPAASGSPNFKTSLTITKVSGSGSSTLAVDINRNSDATYHNRHTFEGDPVVKTYSSTGYTSGYSLYDSDDVKYWRYLGWESQNQRHVTRHQTNVTLDTSKSIFSNIKIIFIWIGNPKPHLRRFRLAAGAFFR